MLIVDGTLVPTRDRAVSASSKNYRYSTNHQVVIDADTGLVVAVGKPLPDYRNDCRTWEDCARRPPSVPQDATIEGCPSRFPDPRRPQPWLAGRDAARSCDRQPS